MTKDTNPGQSATADEPLGIVARALEGIRYGVIQLTVHNGQVTQVDVTERRRFGG